MAAAARSHSSSAVCWAAFAAAAASRHAQFEAHLAAPRAAQVRTLARIVHRNAGSAFGRSHGFAGIDTIDGYRERVPLASWPDVLPWIERAKAGERDVLTTDAIVHFERTSGSSATCKDLPYTRALLGEFQDALVAWLAQLFAADPTIAGRGYWSLSPDVAGLETTPSGIQIGSAGDALYLQGSVAEQLLASLIDTSDVICNPSSWQLATLGRLAAEPDLRLVSVWSPTFLLALLDLLLDPGRTEGTFKALATVLDARRLTVLRAAVEAMDFSLLWPALRIVSCWADGPSAVYAARLGRLLPAARVVPKGLFATEGVVSLSWGIDGDCPLAIDSHFLEFLDRSGRVLLADELTAGERYEPVLTTSGGLYRYRLGDLIEVTGHVAATPSVRFVGRVDQRSDLVGEKLDEPSVRDALDVGADTAILVPVADSDPPHYLLVVDASSVAIEGASALALDVERRLCRFFHYALARRNGQLGEVAVVIVPNLADLLHAAWEGTGRRSGDTKPSALITSPSFARALMVEASKRQTRA